MKKRTASMKRNPAAIRRFAIACLGLLLILALPGCSGSAGSPGSMGGSASPAGGGGGSAYAPQSPPSNVWTESASPSISPSAPQIIGDSMSTDAAWGGSRTEPFTEEEYLTINENRAVSVSDSPLLTFSLKMDTASYRNAVRYIESGSLPPIDAVRTEEMINYFRYEQPLAPNGTPFSIYTELGPSPFSPDNHLAFVRVKSQDIHPEDLLPSNLTFLIDVSGSMSTHDKLPLLQSAFGLLVETLGPNDSVSIVTYAGNSRIALDSARGDEKGRIMDVINSLVAGGSTAGAEGIQTAYRLAEQNFLTNGNNRVILATDGDFNVGISSVQELERFISEKRATGVHLTILGVGTENIKDNRMETLAKNGNGNYHYLDSVATARKVLVDELAANLYVIAEDVKAQIGFNPALVSDYRLIGYENRRLQNRDFADDSVDAGEIGIGTDVVLMFELALHDGSGGELKYGGNIPPAPPVAPGEYGDEFFEVRIRYKDPGENESQLITVPVKTDSLLAWNTSDFQFASSVAAFGHLLRQSPYSGSVEISRLIAAAEDSLGRDEGGLRREFLYILQQYQAIRR